MPQQINLYSPILLTPKRYFSAQAMAQALAVFAFGLSVLCTWTVSSTRTLQRDLQSASVSRDAERKQLLAALGAQPAAASATAIEQELAQERQQLAERQRLLDELTRGQASGERSHSAWLRLLAQTVPPPVWLTEVTLAGDHVALSGMTEQPEALRPWLGRLAAHPLAAGQPFADVKVERAEGSTAGHGELWAFRVAGGNSGGVPR